jgi:hypothetical protein
MARSMEPLLNRTLLRPEDLGRRVIATELVLGEPRFVAWLEHMPALASPTQLAGFIDPPPWYDCPNGDVTLPLTVHGGILAWAGRSVFGFMRNGSGGTVAPSHRAAITKRGQERLQPAPS